MFVERVGARSHENPMSQPCTLRQFLFLELTSETIHQHLHLCRPLSLS